jgi:hypothetical protein
MRTAATITFLVGELYSLPVEEGGYSSRNRLFFELYHKHRILQIGTLDLVEIFISYTAFYLKEYRKTLLSQNHDSPICAKSGILIGEP